MKQTLVFRRDITLSRTMIFLLRRVDDRWLWLMNISLQIINDSVDFLCFRILAPLALDRQHNPAQYLKMRLRTDNLHSLMLEKLDRT